MGNDRIICLMFGKSPEIFVVDIEKSLECLRTIVFGHIEAITENTEWGKIVAICNEDGIRLGLPEAFYGFAGHQLKGTVLICGANDKGDLIDVPDEYVRHLKVKGYIDQLNINNDLAKFI